MKTRDYIKRYLFSSPDFFTGFGSVFNLAGNYYEFPTLFKGFESDKNSIALDWKMVGEDITNSIEKVETERRERQKNQLEINFDA